ncbi:Transglycosylase-like [uncultured Caudovirales phage]|uniref:Transglycosylase-like n=1 Tax=uncultured Caudovirales phage TaxID=2100421 RepID=A0A6J7WIX6_9CAUD|nr:Transglycosylase-like [uncultured Caudovirales phage]
MDETRIDYPRTFAGCLAVIVLLFLGALVGRCSAPAAAQETQPAPDPVVFLGNDNTIEAQAAIAELDAFLVSLTTTTTAVPQYRHTPTPPPSSDTSRWDQLAQCESGGRWDYPPVSGGFSGGIMFHIGTWRAMGGEEFAPDAYLATREQQIDIAERVLAVSGWGAWPGCSRKFGLL